jgi:Ser/Thr protein kinase RdoA (MazF antagonist)
VGSGTVNEVREVEFDGRRTVARLGSRDTDDLDWEIELLQYLRTTGLNVPRLVPTSDGRLRAGTVILMELVDGEMPKDDADWNKVADYLRRLHDATSEGTTQRPGWRSCVDLVTETKAGPVDLTELPDDVLVRCRAAWERLAGSSRTIIHGDPNPTNVRVVDGAVVLLDWDEARLDVPLLDLSALPAEVSGLSQTERNAAVGAAHAWEAALFWTTAPDYARRRLAKLDLMSAE